MRVNVLLFASYADAFGTDSLEVDLNSDARVSDLTERIRQMAGERRLPRAMVALNHAIADADAALSPGDEIALIPPVAGG